MPNVCGYLRTQLQSVSAQGTPGGVFAKVAFSYLCIALILGFLTDTICPQGGDAPMDGKMD